MSDARPAWDIPPSWQPALELARAGSALLLVGAIDSGKSTLAAVLANEALAEGRAVAVVDADVGQSSVGPPACVGLAFPEEEVAGLDDLAPAAIDFVGACSPARHLLQMATSTAVLVDAARSGGAETIIVDTTGLVSGGIARALKGAKIRLLDPEAVVALQQDDEVEHLLAPYRTRAKPGLLRLRMSRAVKARSREERAARRQRKFAAYFADAHEVEVCWETAPFENSLWASGEPAPGHMCAYAEECVACEVLYAERGADGIFLLVDGRPDPVGLRTLGENFGGRAHAVEASSLNGLLVGLVGERGETLALGILEKIDYPRRCLALYAPLSDPSVARGVRLGSVHLARDGSQLGTANVSAIG